MATLANVLPRVAPLVPDGSAIVRAYEENAAMANSSTPFGFMPYGRVDGGSPTYELERTFINSSDANLYFTGDLVYRSTQGNVLQVITAPGTFVPYGVFYGCEFFSAAAGRVVWSRFYPGSVGSNAANGLTQAYVITDPNTLFRCVGATVDGGAGTTWGTSNIGQNATITTSQSSQGNQTTGQSFMALSATTTQNSSAPFKIVDLLSRRAPVGVLPSTGWSGILGTDDSVGFNQIVVQGNSWERGAGQIGAGST